MLDWIVFFLVGAIAGWLARRILDDDGRGLWGNMIVGAAGAVVAGWIFPEIGLGLLGDIVLATAGAVLILGLVRMVRR